MMKGYRDELIKDIRMLDKTIEYNKEQIIEIFDKQDDLKKKREALRNTVSDINSRLIKEQDDKSQA